MKLIIREHTNSIASVKKKEYTVTINAINDYAKIANNVGQMKGDVIVYRSAGDPTRLPVGTNGQVLTADNTAPLGVKWTAGGSGGGGSSAVTLHAPDSIGPVPAYSIVCLDGTETDGVPNLKLATGVTAGVDLYVTQETVTGADVSCMYAIGAIATVRFEGTDAVVGDPISVSLSTAGVGCATNAYPTVGVAVMPSSNGTVQVQLTGGCLNVEALTVGEQVLAGEVVTVVDAIAKKAVLGTKMPYGVTADNTIAECGTGLFAVKAGDVVSVKCNNELVVEGDYLVPSASNAGYVRAGSGYGIGKAMSGKAEGDIGFVKCRLSGGHYGTSTRAWYLVDGLTEENVVAAYKFKGAATMESALKNVNDGEDYSLGATGVTWTTGKGLFFPATVKCYINNSQLVNQKGSIVSCAFGYSDMSTGSVVTAGCFLQSSSSSNPKFVVGKGGYLNESNVAYYQKHVIARSSSSYYTKQSGVIYSNGTLSCDWSQYKMWHDGIMLSLSDVATGYPSLMGAWPSGRVFATCSNSNLARGTMYLSALVFYNAVLTDAQHVQLANQINAL